MDLETTDPHALSSGHARKVRDSWWSRFCHHRGSPAPPALLPPPHGGTEDTAIWSGAPENTRGDPNTGPTGLLEAEERAGHMSPPVPPGAPATCARLRGNAWTGAASLQAPHVRPPAQVVPRRSPWAHRPQQGQVARPLQPGLKAASVSRGQDAAGRTLVLLRQTHGLGARVLLLWAQPEQPREGGSGGLGAAEARGGRSRADGASSLGPSPSPGEPHLFVKVLVRVRHTP